MRDQPPGARWLRCDLHVHTPRDPEKKFGENIRHAIEALRKEKTDRLAAIADRFVQACRAAAGGAGMDLVAVTDHNSIEGYRLLKPFFQSITQRAADEGRGVPVILPGVEFTVGGERPIHFLFVFAAETSVDSIEGAIRHAFQEHEPFDPAKGTPRSTCQSVDEFLKRMYDYCRPLSGDRKLSFVVLPAHADTERGIAKETGALGTGVATTIWDEMRGHLRERVITRRDWHGFETRKPFDELHPAFQDLLVRWAAARRGLDWDKLSETERRRFREQKHWPLIETSDPHRYEDIGSRFTWLKMEVPEVEGIRLALLDPESRLRRPADGPPRQNYPVFTSIGIRRTDFFEDIEIPLGPSLNTLIGGRGAGKSTVIECLRYASDRARGDDFEKDEDEIREAVLKFLQPKPRRDFGETPGMLLPEHEVCLGLAVAGRSYRVTRSNNGIEAVSRAQGGEAERAPLDVRTLIGPRILSQRQIARIARDPAAQRRELDALADQPAMREFAEQRRLLLEELGRLQATRKKLKERLATLPARETELRKVKDQIEFLERGGNKETLDGFRAYQAEERWLRETFEALDRVASSIESQAVETEEAGEAIGGPPDGPTAGWTRPVSVRLSQTISKAAESLRKEAASLRALISAMQAEEAAEWRPRFDAARAAYTQLREEMQQKGVDFAQHANFLQQRSLLEREIKSLRGITDEQARIDTALRETLLRLVQLHEQRLAQRRRVAATLESEGADIRVDLIPFGDRDDFSLRREGWFARTGLQERDWEVLVDHVFTPGGSVPDRLWGLVSALRSDVERAKAEGRVPQDVSGSATAQLVGKEASSRLTKNFLNALQWGERIRLDEMERFLPQDRVEARVRGSDGSFRPISQGSIGQRSTAILSLLLSAGEHPLIIDQPEDDLDNQYVYDVVVDLLRRRKFSRQIIIATHNANIPVNGDAELIVALGVHGRLGTVLAGGSIDRPEVKNHVSIIMEGSAEAFRLRQERYGY